MLKRKINITDIVIIILLIVSTASGLEDNWRHYDIGMKRIREKNYKAAMNQFSYYIKHEKLHRHMFGVAYFGMGLVHEAKGEYNLAIIKYALAIQNDLHPTVKVSEKAYMNLGGSYMRTKAYKEAVSAYLRAIKINPENGYAHYYLGLAYLKNHEYEKARKEAEEAEKMGITFTALLDKLSELKVDSAEKSDY